MGGGSDEHGSKPRRRFIRKGEWRQWRDVGKASGHYTIHHRRLLPPTRPSLPHYLLSHARKLQPPPPPPSLFRCRSTTPGLLLTNPVGLVLGISSLQ
ncbi:hypothetical protein E2C01_044651 [Portunus trituberculatus]|uniref:Uncharacterized protein n=1 Tax=Portunus trituberculatus TaxID=210409 RepID=A0A5B7FZR5_PORTR|nr:hypothetical protein [Portunus trituberculatus]